MDCREIQNRLAVGEIPDAVQQRHLEACAACRAFASDLQGLRRLLTAPPATPSRLRDETLTLCRGSLPASGSAPQAARRDIPRLSPRAVVVTALLGTVVLIGISVAVASDTAPSRHAVQAVLVQVLVQNIVAALLAPALWPWLRRLVPGPVSPRLSTGG